MNSQQIESEEVVSVPTVVNEEVSQELELQDTSRLVLVPMDFEEVIREQFIDDLLRDNENYEQKLNFGEMIANMINDERISERSLSKPNKHCLDF